MTASSLSDDAKTATGCYFYYKYCKDIRVDGTIDGRKIVMHEYDGNGHETGRFVGEFPAVDPRHHFQTANDLQTEVITGYWSKPDGSKSQPFYLSQTFSGSWLPGSRYVVAGFEHEHDVDVAMARFRAENNWSISELAEKLSMSQPAVTKALKYREGCEELRAALHAGLIDQDKAYTICQEPDHDKQRELLKRANDLTREQLRQKARSNGQVVDLKASVARFPLPGGVMVSVQGRKMNLGGAIEAMLDVVKELKKGQADHWDITTAMRVLRHRAQQATK